jgi:hypothetical protein
MAWFEDGTAWLHVVSTPQGETQKLYNMDR